MYKQTLGAKLLKSCLNTMYEKKMSQLINVLIMNSFTMRNLHFFVGLLIMTMCFKLIFESFWCKIIGVFLGISFLVYWEAGTWIKRIVKKVTGCVEKYMIFCIVYLNNNQKVK